MTLKSWYETMGASDCFSGHVTWNDMTDYIKHSACTDFIIHSTCTSGGQAFRFTANGTLSMLVGGADSGDDLGIYANDTNLCASIKLYGDGDIINKIKWDSTFEVSTCSDEELLIVSPTALTYKGTNICLAPCAGVAGSCPTKGDLPFTLYDNCETETGIGFQFTIAGTLSTLEGGNDSSDDFLLSANSSNDCSWTKWFGDAGIRMAIKAASGFEVSTCSDETLWEIDSNPADKHVDFHCLDAHNFVLELRTTNPSSPTCLGQIWFRTDLV